MVTLGYGQQKVQIAENTMELSKAERALLLNGDFIIDTGISIENPNKVRKAYYLGVLFEIFMKNYHPSHSKIDIYMMIFNAYPVFLNLRQAQDVVAEYFELKKSHNVFS